MVLDQDGETALSELNFIVNKTTDKLKDQSYQAGVPFLSASMVFGYCYTLISII